MKIDSYVLSLGTLVIFVTVITLLLPNGKMKKIIKTVLSIAVVLQVFKPVLDLKGRVFDTDPSHYISVQEGFIEYSDFYLISAKESATENLLKTLGYNGSNVDIIYEGTGSDIRVKKVVINLRGDVIISDKENIHIKEEIIDSVSTFLNIEKGLIFISE